MVRFPIPNSDRILSILPYVSGTDWTMNKSNSFLTLPDLNRFLLDEVAPSALASSLLGWMINPTFRKP